MAVIRSTAYSAKRALEPNGLSKKGGQFVRSLLLPVLILRLKQQQRSRGTNAHTTRDSLRKETMVRRRRPQRVVGVTVAAFAFAFLPVLLLMSVPVRSRIPEVGEQRSSVAWVPSPCQYAHNGNAEMGRASREHECLRRASDPPSPLQFQFPNSTWPPRMNINRVGSPCASSPLNRRGGARAPDT